MMTADDDWVFVDEERYYLVPDNGPVLIEKLDSSNRQNRDSPSNPLPAPARTSQKGQERKPRTVSICEDEGMMGDGEINDKVIEGESNSTLVSR